MVRLSTMLGILILAVAACAQQSDNEIEEVVMAGQKNLTIDYIEFPATDMAATKKFYTDVFGWEFTDYGPDYASFPRAQAGIDGGFTSQTAPAAPGTLAVFYADDLEAVETSVRDAGGEIVQEIFSFPGGRRFHFKDPSGNELAVWSDKGVEN